MMPVFNANQSRLDVEPLMLSYRHAFHAGNHADVLKHLVLLALLQQMHKKDKPFCCIDTHSGAGWYRLDGDQARKTGEASTGILPLWEAWRQHGCDNPLLRDYLELVAASNPVDTGDSPVYYPGSPAIIQSQLRDNDRAQLMELHTTEIDILRENMGRDARVSIHHRDGFEGAVGLVPPEPKRGLLLIDPAYEDKRDYQQAVKSLLSVNRRWQTGVLVLWYPMLGKTRDRSEWLKSQLCQQLETQVVEWVVGEQAEEFGMHGSGMLVVNPPWQFDTVMADALQALRDMLSKV
ncbi:23S rRNA (adenine(2030)-N(6))-methyltransferase RlmJ [Pseudohongiella sp. SYSU M77423]|uniref:23S rRNA (adenine(2030)-N(6))-methyltransferase RlmJ n=1 Tax=Pseudohongiella sp. SYSU M77423 TaxID=3042312 RepID=UPI002481152E|nr:23S rRNA (adenine(2030)-N(6))-methyltransferase RlmJ [Pseudohongiella sp. SYSU M77423]MDH7942480.1 23S rRNA (adenine(2030)-N(6))-methyltransferase RlmJ [Pseudohongiella sp. SYSU M77423]